MIPRQLSSDELSAYSMTMVYLIAIILEALNSDYSCYKEVSCDLI